jgi:hypothetical protein
MALAAAPVNAQIADRVDRGYDNRSVFRPGDDCARYDRYGDHRWDDYGWDGDARESWRNDGLHRDRRDRDRDRARCAEWIRRTDSRRSRFAYEHDRLHDQMWRDHLQWHRRHANQPHNRGWTRSHANLHEKLAREHARWHRRHDHEYGYNVGRDHRYDDGYRFDDDDHGRNRPGRARGRG